jgi:hypothetical protein
LSIDLLDICSLIGFLVLQHRAAAWRSQLLTKVEQGMSSQLRRTHCTSSPGLRLAERRDD